MTHRVSWPRRSARLVGAVALGWVTIGHVVAQPESAHVDATALEGDLRRVIEVVRAREKTGEPSLAVHVTPSGHWRIANAKAEVVTAAGVEELRRATRTLSGDDGAPGATAARSPLMAMTFDAAARAALDPTSWPASSRLSLVADGEVLPLRWQAEDGKDILVAEVRPHLLLQIGPTPAIAEAMWQLSRPISADAVRVLSLEPGGARTLRSRPVRETGSRLSQPDVVDPYGLAKALPALKGQKVLVVGRLDKELLWYQPRSGPEQSILVADLKSAAAESDIALVLLDTRLPRQPGERTWAYLKVGVPGLENAMMGRTVADFYGGLGAAHGQMLVRVIDVNASRTRMEAVPLRTAWGRLTNERGVGGVLQDVVSGLTGNLSPLAARLELPSRSRHEELMRRWVPGIPSTHQIAYALLLALGLASWPATARWWQRLWPGELRRDYRSAVGFTAASTVRWAIFVFGFLPAVALVAFPIVVASRLWEGLRMVAVILGVRRGRASRAGGRV